VLYDTYSITKLKTKNPYNLEILTSVLDGGELSASQSDYFTLEERPMPIG
jgi:hypothetical protein